MAHAISIKTELMDGDAKKETGGRIEALGYKKEKLPRRLNFIRKL